MRVVRGQSGQGGFGLERTFGGGGPKALLAGERTRFAGEGRVEADNSHVHRCSGGRSSANPLACQTTMHQAAVA
jgi:hypothetical protein